MTASLLRACFSLVAAVAFFGAPANADVYRWDTGDIIPGTEGITPRAGAWLAGAQWEFADLSHADLAGAIFGHARLTSSDLRGATLTGANFFRATLTSANFGDAVVTGTTFEETTSRGFTPEQLYSTASYQNHDLSGIGLARNDLARWNFNAQSLADGDFYAATLTGADFEDAVVTGASFGDTTSRGFTREQLYATASYRDKDLTDIGLALNDLSGWNFGGQNLTGAGFYRATLTGADLRGADLMTASFYRALLTGANLSDAVVAGASFEEATSRGFTHEQLYSTASYKNKDLSGIELDRNDLSGWNFGGQNLTGADFREAILTSADLSHADLTDVDFAGATLTSANLSHADLAGIDFQGVMLANADLSHADLEQADFRRGVLVGSNLSLANLAWADFGDATLTSADLSHADLRGAIFPKAILTSTNLSQANLAGADFGDATLAGADLSDAVVTGASFQEATSRGFTAEQLYSTASYRNMDLSGIKLPRSDLSGWNFTGQKITGADFRGAMLTGADLSHAHLTEAQFSGAMLSSTDLSHADLRGMDFEGVTLTSANLSHADLGGARFARAILTSANLSQANLAGADFGEATLAGPDLTDAVVTGASFREATSRGFTADQLYSTANYKNRDLSGINLDGNDLSGWNFTGQNLTGAVFREATLTNADFHDAVVNGTSFEGTTGFTAEQLYATASYKNKDLSRIRLWRNDLSGWSFAGQDLTAAEFYFANLTNADLRQADLTDADFSGATLTGTDLSHANLAGLNFQGASLSSVNLSHAHLAEADFQFASLSGANLSHADLTGTSFVDASLPMADLSQANLTRADFSGASLSGADLTDAVVTGASFASLLQGGLSPEQLYSTASYKMKDLSGIGLAGNLSGWILAGQNLAGANLNGSGADLTGADLRGAQLGRELPADMSRNSITPGGEVRGLDLRDGEALWIRDFDGGPQGQPPIPIRISRTISIAEGGVLRLIFDADFWDSTISFRDGRLVRLGGTLELAFAADVDVAAQVGRTLDVFDWTGVDPSGAFDVTSPYLWDLSQLYTTGEVRLTGTGGVGDYDGSGVVDQGDLDLVLLNWGADGIGPPAGWINDLPVGMVDQVEIDRTLLNWGMNWVSPLPSASVPEPSGSAMLALAALLVGIYELSRRTGGRRLKPQRNVPGISPRSHGEQAEIRGNCKLTIENFQFSIVNFQSAVNYRPPTRNTGRMCNCSSLQSAICGFMLLVASWSVLDSGAAEYTPLIVSGSPANRVDVVVIGDGYTDEQLATEYRPHVTSLVDYLFGGPHGDPFARYRNFFNVHEVAVASNESGADAHRHNGPFRDTALGAAYYSDGQSDLRLGIHSGDADRIASESLPREVWEDIDLRIALVNDTTFGGTGGTWATYAAGYRSAYEIGAHEIGHSFARLADEYFTAGTTYTGFEPPFPNVTTGTDKWDRWLGYVDPDHPELGPVDYYEGGVYHQFGIYRPTQTSRMVSVQAPWNAVSREAIIDAIYRNVRPLDDWLGNGEVLANPQNLWVAPIDATVFGYEWFIDGEQVSGAEGESLDVSGLRQSPGEHTVRVRVYDRVLDHAFTGDSLDWWRRDDTSLLQQDVVWTIYSTLAGDYNGDGLMEQGDLDLVLMNWGHPAPPPSSGWVVDLPVGEVSQTQLDQVLLNWGRASGMLTAAVSVPEPGAAALVAVALGVLVSMMGRIRDVKRRYNSDSSNSSSTNRPVLGSRANADCGNAPSSGIISGS